MIANGSLYAEADAGARVSSGTGGTGAAERYRLRPGAAAGIDVQHCGFRSRRGRREHRAHGAARSDRNRGPAGGGLGELPQSDSSSPAQLTVSATCLMVSVLVYSKKWVGCEPPPELAANKMLLGAPIACDTEPGQHHFTIVYKRGIARFSSLPCNTPAESIDWRVCAKAASGRVKRIGRD